MSKRFLFDELSDYDLYIELTTLKQELVTKKNRKVRQLKRLYPGIKVKVMYAKDYKRLLEKFARGMKSDRKDDGDKKTAPSDLCSDRRNDAVERRVHHWCCCGQ